LGLAQHPSVKSVAQTALEKYGCGSCGPRGFYGTIDVHLGFEKAISKYMKTEEAICYSDGASSLSSFIPAFAKKGDLLIVDEACCEPIVTGLTLSRATIQYFKHNDMVELNDILESIASDDAKLRRDSTQQRRFIVVEGIYRNTGQLCHIQEVVRLKEKYHYRLFLDESLSFGTLGSAGRGITEFANVDSASVEFLNISFETVLGSTGGVCVGTREVVDHQRLSGAGYCFSAAAPPFFSATAIESLRLLETDVSLRKTLQQNVIRFRDNLITGNLLEFFEVSDAPSPVLHLTLKSSLGFGFDEEASLFADIASKCLVGGVAIASKGDLGYLKASGVRLRPSARLVVNGMLSAADIDRASKLVQSVATTTASAALKLKRQEK
jgi:serine palmitoyltransferase